jgi:hypothetical protein
VKLIGFLGADSNFGSVNRHQCDAEIIGKPIDPVSEQVGNVYRYKVIRINEVNISGGHDHRVARSHESG